jgi:8-oxo-dGTP diphosphatase
MAPPFPTVPVTVDIIIELNDREIVLIERRDPPHGIALPGGFVNPGESLAEAAVREAKEETGLDVDLVEQFFAYSKPGRDSRGPVVSVVFVGMAMGTPVGADDAKSAEIYDIGRLPPNEDMAFDHGQILGNYLGWRNHGVRPGPHR